MDADLTEFRARTLGAVRAMEVDLDEGPEPRAFYGRLSQRLAHLVGAEMAGFARLNLDGDAVHLQRDTYNVPEAVMEAFQTIPADREGRTLAGQIVHHGAVVNDNAEESSRWRPYRDVIVAGGIREVLGAPWESDQPLGLIFAYNSPRPEGFSELDLWTLQLLGRLAGMVWKLRQGRDELRDWQGHALQVNDVIVKRLVAAETALDVDLPDRSREAVDAALSSSRRIISDLLTDVRDGRPFAGSLRRYLTGDAG